MDVDDLRSIIDEAQVDIWSLIETAISVAAADYREELKARRDRIVELLYAPTFASAHGSGEKAAASPSSPPRAASENGEEEDNPGEEDTRSGDQDIDELDEFGGLFDEEEARILKIKQQLEGPDQTEDTLVGLLQNLADMDITFLALKETDIGRHVNRLRKHISADVRRLVKLLVRKWKEIVDEWVRTNPQGDHSTSTLMADADSPQQKNSLNGHHQVPDFAGSPNTHDGSSGSDKNRWEPERKPKPLPRKEVPGKPAQSSVPSSHANAQRQREQPRASNFDADAKLASASKRLQANYKEAENAKRQRTIQVIQDIPKPKSRNTFLPKTKSGGSHGRHW